MIVQQYKSPCGKFTVICEPQLAPEGWVLFGGDE